MSIKRAVERYIGGGYKAEPMSDMFWGLYREKLEADAVADAAASKAWDVMEAGFKQERAVLKHEPDIAYREGFIEGEARGIDRAIPVGSNYGYVEGFKKGFLDAIDAQHKPIRLYDVQDKYRGTKPLSQVFKIEDLTATIPDEKRFRGLRAWQTDAKKTIYYPKEFKHLKDVTFAHKPHEGLILLNMEKLFSKDKSSKEQMEDIVKGKSISSADGRAAEKIAELTSQIKDLVVSGGQLEEEKKLLESEREIQEDKEKWEQVELERKAVADEERKTHEQAKKLRKDKQEVTVPETGRDTFQSADKKSVKEIVNIVLGEPVVTEVEPTPRDRVPKRQGHNKRARAAAGHHAQVEEIIDAPEIKKTFDKFDLLNAGFPSSLAENKQFIDAIKADESLMSLLDSKEKTFLRKGSPNTMNIISVGKKLLNNPPGPKRFDKIKDNFEDLVGEKISTPDKK